MTITDLPIYVLLYCQLTTKEKGLINTIMCRQTYDIQFSVDGKRQMICRPER